MPTAGKYVVVQYAVAQLIDSNETLSVDDFMDAIRGERAIKILAEDYSEIVDLSVLTESPEELEEMEVELSETVMGNPPDEYGIVENGFAGYVVSLSEIINAH